MDIKAFEAHLKPYIEHNVELIKSLLKEGDIFIDVGANSGLLSKTIIDSLGHSYLEKSILFEPIPPFAEECREKFKNIDNVIVEQLALSDSISDKKMLVSKINLGYSKIYKEGMDIHPHYEYTVKCNTLSNWLLENNIDKVNFIKIDAEGHDINVIEGAIDFLHRSSIKPYILFECGWYKEEEYNLVQKMEKLFNYKYEFFNENSRLSGDILLKP